jgi:hypothetical protein
VLLRPPQLAALSAAARGEEAGGASGLAHGFKFARRHALQYVRPIASNAIDQVHAAVATLYLLLARVALDGFYGATTLVLAWPEKRRRRHTAYPDEETMHKVRTNWNRYGIT